MAITPAGYARAEKIRRLFAEGQTKAQISRTLKVPKTAVYEVLNNDRYPEGDRDASVPMDVAALTPSRRMVYDFLVAYLRDHRIPPTVREIAGAQSHSINHVYKILMYLYRNGLIDRVHGTGQSRCWIPTVRDFCPCCRRPMDQTPDVQEVPCGAN